MTGTTVVRPLHLTDWAAFRDLRLQALRLHPQAFGTTAKAWEAAPREQTETALRDSEGPSENVVFGAFAPELVGMLGFRREQRTSLAHKGSFWGLFVREDARHAGSGAALLCAALEHARSCAKLEYVRVVVTTRSTNAMRLFLGHGFVRYGLEVDGIQADGRSYDQAFLRADLRVDPERPRADLGVGQDAGR